MTSDSDSDSAYGGDTDEEEERKRRHERRKRRAAREAKRQAEAAAASRDSDSEPSDDAEAAKAKERARRAAATRARKRKRAAEAAAKAAADSDGASGSAKSADSKSKVSASDGKASAKSDGGSTKATTSDDGEKVTAKASSDASTTKAETTDSAGGKVEAKAEKKVDKAAETAKTDASSGSESEAPNAQAEVKSADGKTDVAVTPTEVKAEATPTDTASAASEASAAPAVTATVESKASDASTASAAPAASEAAPPATAEATTADGTKVTASAAPATEGAAAATTDPEVTDSAPATASLTVERPGIDYGDSPSAPDDVTGPERVIGDTTLVPGNPGWREARKAERRARRERGSTPAPWESDVVWDEAADAWDALWGKIKDDVKWLSGKSATGTGRGASTVYGGARRLARGAGISKSGRRRSLSGSRRGPRTSWDDYAIDDGDDWDVPRRSGWSARRLVLSDSDFGYSRGNVSDGDVSISSSDAWDEKQAFVSSLLDHLHPQNLERYLGELDPHQADLVSRAFSTLADHVDSDEDVWGTSNGASASPTAVETWREPSSPSMMDRVLSGVGRYLVSKGRTALRGRQRRRDLKSSQPRYVRDYIKTRKKAGLDPDPVYTITWVQGPDGSSYPVKTESPRSYDQPSSPYW